MERYQSDQTSVREKPFERVRNYYRQTKQDLWKVQKYNFHTICKQPLAEISGSFGDLGTLLPILIALTINGTIDLASTLVFSGLANILTGVIYGIPLPVQPMKAIAAVAIARNFSPAENASAGLFVAGAIGFLSLTSLIKWFTDWIPIPVVKGIQVGTGLALAMSVGNLLHITVLNGFIYFFLCLGVILTTHAQRMPYALILLIVGILAVMVSPVTDDSVASENWHYFELWHPHTLIPSPSAFAKGTLEAGIGQLPLTTLNSVIAVSFLAADLFPDLSAPSTTSLGISVMGINLVGCWFGAMPVCHGSGGLAAQYRFGARSGSSIIFLGLLKLLLGLLAQNLASVLFARFPSTILCALLMAAGIELGQVGQNLNTSGARDIIHEEGEAGSVLYVKSKGHGVSELTDDLMKRRWTVMLVTVVFLLTFKNDAVGFLAGMTCHWSLLLLDRWQGNSRIRLLD